MNSSTRSAPFYINNKHIQKVSLYELICEVSAILHKHTYKVSILYELIYEMSAILHKHIQKVSLYELNCEVSAILHKYIQKVSLDELNCEISAILHGTESQFVKVVKVIWTHLRHFTWNIQRKYLFYMNTSTRWALFYIRQLQLVSLDELMYEVTLHFTWMSYKKHPSQCVHLKKYWNFGGGPKQISVRYVGGLKRTN